MTVTESIDNTDTAGEAVTTDLDVVSNDIRYQWVAIIDNGFNVNVDVTVQFTTGDDASFSKFVTDNDLSSITVPSGDRDGFGDASNNPWSYLRFEIDPSSDPTGGKVEVTWQRRLGGSD